jgi:hypothetical protein
VFAFAVETGALARAESVDPGGSRTPMGARSSTPSTGQIIDFSGPTIAERHRLAALEMAERAQRDRSARDTLRPVVA